jgi:glucose/mannose transport system substrate-binding protein
VQNQKKLARILLDKEFQRELSIANGASPARVDIDTDGFNSCGKKSIHDLRMANMRRAVMASLNSKDLFKVVADYLQDKSSPQTAANQVITIFTKQPKSPLTNSQ